jgi:5-methyltetrahydrofolate--homocysteine methyltransferase
MIMTNIIELIAKNIESGDREESVANVNIALAANIKPEEIMNNGLIEGMNVLGERWKRNEVFVPEVLIAARALTSALEILRPLLEKSGVKPKGKALIGTVKGDLHDIGKNLVKMMLVGSGFEVIDMGVDVSGEQFVEGINKESPDIILLSALLTTTMPQQGEIINALKEANVRDKVKVMVGGAPVTKAFAENIGADAYTPDAASAAEKAIEFVTNKQ